LWLREAAVKPNHQRQGISKQLGKVLLKDAMGLQPVAAYIWPDEINFLPDVLQDLGFTPTEEKMVKLYGEDKLFSKQVRMQAPSAKGVLNRLG